MRKGILLCSGGMSTTVIRDKLNEINDLDFKFDALGITGTNWTEILNKYELVLVSPQIRFSLSEIKSYGDSIGVKVMAIKPVLYTPFRADDLWGEIKDFLNSNNG